MCERPRTIVPVATTASGRVSANTNATASLSARVWRSPSTGHLHCASSSLGGTVFVLTASYIETFVENTALDIKPDRTLMLRFELKHLGDFNYRTDALNHVFGDTNTGRVN